MEKEEKDIEQIENLQQDVKIVEYRDDENLRHRAFISDESYLKYIEDRYYNVTVCDKNSQVDFS